MLFNNWMTNKIICYILALLICCNNFAFAADEPCSRTARINFQEVLVDTSSSRKGEGIKYYLEKDPTAKTYYDTYVKKQKNQLIHSVLGTTAIGLILNGVLKSNDPNKNNFQNKGVWIASGALLIGLNILLAHTLSISNEKNLQRAVKEYNKRNLPKIHFGPFINQFENERNSSSRKFGVGGQISKEF